MVDTPLSVVESLSVVFVSVWVTTWLRVGIVQWLSEKYCAFGCKKEVAHKAAESTWFGLYYLIMWIVAVVLCFREPWLYNSRLFWRDFPHPMSRRFGLYYAIQGGYYLSSLFFELNVFPHFRAHYKDRTVMLFHHIVTLLLISLSALFGYWRVGMVVFLLHDVSDIALECGKTQTRLQIRGNHITLLIFAVLFFITRLVLYPIHVVYSAWYVSDLSLSLSLLFIRFSYSFCWMGLSIQTITNTLFPLHKREVFLMKKKLHKLSHLFSQSLSLFIEIFE
jgi:hypothetical protein